jgi:AraC family transcriptional regulator
MGRLLRITNELLAAGVSALAAQLSQLFRRLAVLAAEFAEGRVFRDAAFAGRVRAFLRIIHDPASRRAVACRCTERDSASARRRQIVSENVRIMALDIRTVSPKRLAAVRHVGPYNQVGPAFRELGKIAGPAGLFGFPGAMMVGVYHDDPRTTPSDQLRASAGLVVPDSATIPAGLIEERLEPGTFAVYLHAGSYAGLPDAWRRASASVAESGRTLRRAASYEFYLNDPGQVPESALKTEIYLPID